MSLRHDGYYVNIDGNWEYIEYEPVKRKSFTESITSMNSGRFIDDQETGQYTVVETKQESLFQKFKKADWTPLWMKWD